MTASIVGSNAFRGTIVVVVAPSGWQRSHTHVNTHVPTHVPTHVHMHACTHVHTHVSAHVYTHVQQRAIYLLHTCNTLRIQCTRTTCATHVQHRCSPPHTSLQTHVRYTCGTRCAYVVMACVVGARVVMPCRTCGTYCVAVVALQKV